MLIFDSNGLAIRFRCLAGNIVGTCHPTTRRLMRILFHYCANSRTNPITIFQEFVILFNKLVYLRNSLLIALFFSTIMNRE
ncbi:hypothetical protein ACHAXS_003472 [Conticribra weissflogii]